MRFLILGRLEKEKKSRKNKFWKTSLELRGPVPRHNIQRASRGRAWKQQGVVTKSSWRQWRTEKSTSLLESNENREQIWVNVYLYTAHVTSCLMAVYNSIAGVRSNVSLSRRLWLPLSVHFWSRSPIQPMYEMWVIDHHTGNFVPYPFRQVRGFFNVPC